MENKVLMPGLINAHTHCGMTILRNYANDLNLEEWLLIIFCLQKKTLPEDIYWGTLLGISEMIKLVLQLFRYVSTYGPGGKGSGGYWH